VSAGGSDLYDTSVGGGREGLIGGGVGWDWGSVVGLYRGSDLFVVGGGCGLMGGDG